MQGTKVPSATSKWLKFERCVAPSNSSLINALNFACSEPELVIFAAVCGLTEWVIEYGSNIK